MAAPNKVAAVTFIVPGIRADRGATRGAGGATPVPANLRVKDSITVTAQRSAGEAEVRVVAIPGEDVVMIEVANGPALWLHPDHARELLQSQQDDLLLSRGSAAPAAGEVRVPARLKWRVADGVAAPGATRSALGDVLVRGIQVLTGFAEEQAAKFVASKVVKAVDAQVDPGVYRLDPQLPDSLKGKPTSAIAGGEAPSLVLIHGTFSNTPGTFGKLWNEHPDLVGQLFKRFPDRVYALDHPTLGVSPIANAITLAEAAPEGARLHLLTHSRGGLVAEVLARVCSEPNESGIELFADDGSSVQELKKLVEIVARKRINVDRVVRVACPSRGTLLASKRLDAYVSVLKWALELAQIPVVPDLVNFLGEVAKRRAEPDEVPGLAAQIPDSPLVKWLNRTGERIKGDLRVIAGDLEGDSISSWVKTLLSDAFFWTDNDLVVQTRSMYGGSPREKDSTFVLDQGGKVSHFNYFSNRLTATAVVNALALSEDLPDEFRVIGPLSWSGKSATGMRAALPTRNAQAAAELPALFVLPGLLGSNLKDGDDRIWLGWRLVNGFGRLAYDPKATNIAPDGPIGIYYDDLSTFFSGDHDVKPFAFDWRRPIAAEAKRLAAEVTAALDARKTSKQPVRIIAHSMGGLVARAMQIYSRSTWDRMIAADGARVLMLGTPNGGSWAPMQVLSGDDTFGNLLSSVGAPFDGGMARKLIANFPGILQLQAGLLNGLGTEAAWKDLAAADLAAAREHNLWHNLGLQFEQLEWGIPGKAVLDQAIELRRALDRQRDTDLASFANKLLLVVGKAESTPAGYRRSGDGSFVYLDAPNQGDGRVLHDSAVLPGVATWMVNVDHGSLPRHKEAFAGYRDLLIQGRTERLQTLTAAQGTARGADVVATKPLVPSRPSRQLRRETPPEREVDVLASSARSPTQVSTSSAAGLRITVVNGDLTYVSSSLLVGHYRSSRLSGTEAVVDRQLGRALSTSLQRDLYPDSPGTYQVFTNPTKNPDNPWDPPRPEAAIVAGLGAEGELRGSDLVRTVRQAVIGWAQRLTERNPIPTQFKLAAALLGSGGTGITAGQAAQLIAQGVREANEELEQGNLSPPAWPRVAQLNIIEIYFDRAAEAWNALQALAASTPAHYVVEKIIREQVGALHRPPEAGYRGAEYDFISALVSTTEQGNQEIIYTVNSKRARSDVRPKHVQIPLIQNLVLHASDHANSDTNIGRTLFNLLVPVDLEPFLSGSTETVIELDEGSAAIPWEVLDSPAPANRNTPWSIRTKLVRKLRTAAPTIAVTTATADDGILVIGDPACDRTKYPTLAAARQEASRVAACLGGKVRRNNSAAPQARYRHPPPLVTALISSDFEPNAIAVMNAVMQPSWRIIHIAGHGEPPIVVGKGIEPRGVVLSDGIFLSAKEIGALRTKPELVFVNCCHLATNYPDQFLQSTNYDRARFAAGVANALIESGVRCVIAAGWAVDDEAASRFAEKFYDELLEGRQFIDAVATARLEAYKYGGNTWAAYQCYGDPNWQFRNQNDDPHRALNPTAPNEFANIASAFSLILVLEQIKVESEYQGKNPEDQAVRLRYLEAMFGQRWGGRGDVTEALYWGERGEVAEAFGNAWARCMDLEKAITWYERARNAEDGTASLASIEQLANVRIRLAWQRADRDYKAIDPSRTDINNAIELLERLVTLAPTVERQSLCGSGYKRLALLEAKARAEAAEQNAIARMWTHYMAAETLARERPSTSAQPLFYPAMNRIVAQLALADETRRRAALDPDTIALVVASMRSGWQDFWSTVGQTELRMLVSLAANALARDATELIEEFGIHHARVGNPRFWSSVFDNATFVLSRYQGRASQAEAAAAQQILVALGALAGNPGPSTSASSGASKGASKAAPAGKTKATRKARAAKAAKPPRKSPLPKRKRPKRKT